MAAFTYSRVSPPGRGAIHVIHVRGPDAAGVVARMHASGDRDPARARYGRFVPAGDRSAVDVLIDDGMVIPITGGYLLTVHGNPLIADHLCEALRAAGGTERAASPWLGAGRSEIAAEAYALLPQARTAPAAGFLLEQATAGLAAWADRVRAGTHQPSQGELARMLADARRGRALFEPRTVVLAGIPNAGKSTLFNTLVGTRRVVTHATPGTTRDLIREEITIGAYPVLLVDGAGVRAVDDAIEREGVDRIMRAIADADLVVLLEPAGSAGDAAGPELAAAVAVAERDMRLLRVRSRIDEDPSSGVGAVRLGVSGRTGLGVPELVREIARRVFGGTDVIRGRPVPFSIRHEQWLASLAGKR